MSSQENGATYQAVRYDSFGGTDVFYLAELPKPHPGLGEALVRVKAAGINPGEAAIRMGKMVKQYPSSFPSGQGSDFAGIIEAVGASVTDVTIGAEVIGFTNARNSQAEYIVVAVDQLIRRPANVPWEQAGGLFVAGTTAYATLQAVALKAGETVIISGAAGGVGSLAVQLAKNKGANVIGLASEPNHDWLRKHGVIPVAYEGNIANSLKTTLDGAKADAFIDTSGKGYVELALTLDIPPDRIDTIIDFEAAAKYKVKTAGNTDAATRSVLSELVEMIANGRLDIPIAKTYPLAKVKEAYDELEQAHTHGKIILIP